MHVHLLRCASNVFNKRKIGWYLLALIMSKLRSTKKKKCLKATLIFNNISSELKIQAQKDYPLGKQFLPQRLFSFSPKKHRVHFLIMAIVFNANSEPRHKQTHTHTQQFCFPPTLLRLGSAHIVGLNCYKLYLLTFFCKLVPGKTYVEFSRLIQHARLHGECNLCLRCRFFRCLFFEGFW